MNPCGTCDDFVADATDPAKGRCHLYPPIVSVAAQQASIYTTQTVNVTANGQWPMVNADGPSSGCSEWNARPV